MDIFKKQVNRSHYRFSKYVDKRRWNSIWHQIDEVSQLNPKNVLEIGPGPGIFKALGHLFGLEIKTLDLDAELSPDYICSVDKMLLPNLSFDVVCAFQVLEHLPYDRSLQALSEMIRVSRRYVLISLPDAKPIYRFLFQLPKKLEFNWLLPRPFSKLKVHHHDGQHYWEINKKGYSLEKIINDFSSELLLRKTYRVKENAYHRFFLFEKK